MIDVNCKDKTLFSDKITQLNNKLTVALQQVDEQFDDHLTAINENTHEIQATYEYLAEIDGKLNKLAERVDKLQLFLEQKTGCLLEEKKTINPQPLTNREKEVFMALFSLENEKGMVTVQDISKRTALPEMLVEECISAMASKEVPIIKKLMNKRFYLKIDPNFKSLQQHANVLQIEQRLISELLG